MGSQQPSNFNPLDRSSKNSVNTSQNSMNISDAGYQRNMSMDSKGASEPRSQDVGPSTSVARSSSAGGVEDLGNWLKFESNKKYEESLLKLQLDTSKI